MTITTLKYSPSINIVRDNEYSFKYIPTPNSTTVFERILLNVEAGLKSQIIIGAYGTGKSSLLLAFQQTLKGAYKHFDNCEALLDRAKKYQFIPVIGDYASIIETFADIFGVTSNRTANNTIKAIDKAYQKVKKEGSGIAFVIDEFGKFLEYAAKNNPEAELYFLQLLAEWTNNTNTDALLITTLHKGFNSYATKLSPTQYDEWDKVKGRFKELLFNEPVEQLLFLASERLAKDEKAVPDKKFRKLFDCISHSKAFPLKDYFTIEIAQKLYPLDILSAAVLTLALQEYGQNERSLFSFLESADSFSIAEFKKANSDYFSIPQVYDYLLTTFYSTLLINGSNPHYDQWSSIKRTLERLEGVSLQQPIGDAQCMIKTIGLLHLFTPAGAHIGEEFITTYGNLSLDIANPKAVLDELVGFMLIRYSKEYNRYVIFEGTDLNITLAIDNAGKIVERVSNVVSYLEEYADLSIISAKAYSYRTGTPRLFKFILSETPVIQVPDGEIDGFINLVFSSDKNILDRVAQLSQQCDEAILYGCYQNITAIQNTLFEIQKVQKVIASHPNDRTAVRLLEEIKDYYSKLLHHQLIDSLYANDGSVSWFWQGVLQPVENRKQFNQILSDVCESIYPDTPIFKNELINKTKVSSQISAARKIITSRLLNNSEKENVGFETNKFPPEKTIYLSLLKETGIHVKNNETWSLQAPKAKSFSALWKASETFLENSKGKQRSLQEFEDMLYIKPFKLKQGFIDIWVPVFLLVKADEYALFDDKGYIPALNQDILDLINKKPGNFFVKAFDVEGIKLDLFNRYRTYLSQPETDHPTNKLLIQTIKPFLVFYKGLNEYAKTTKTVSKSTIAFREVIAKSQDPEKIIFDDMPTALGYSVQSMQNDPTEADKYITEIKASILELRKCYDELLNRFEEFIVKGIVKTNTAFPEYKTLLADRYKKLQTHALPIQYRSFFSRLTSAIDDRASWLNSISQACINKQLINSKDEDEAMLYDRFSHYITVLDSLIAINEESNNEEEEVVKVDLTTSVEGAKTKMIRIFKSENNVIVGKRDQIKNILGDDQQLSLAVLATLLQEYLGNE